MIRNDVRDASQAQTDALEMVRPAGRQRRASACSARPRGFLRHGGAVQQSLAKRPRPTGDRSSPMRPIQHGWEWPASNTDAAWVKDRPRDEFTGGQTKMMMDISAGRWPCGTAATVDERDFADKNVPQYPWTWSAVFWPASWGFRYGS